MDDRTLGQIAYEAAAAAEGCWQPWELANQRKWKAAAKAVCDVIFEEFGLAVNADRAYGGK